MKRPTLGEFIERRIGRRDALRVMAGAAAALAAPPAAAGTSDISSLGFAELDHGFGDMHRVADGYDAQVLIRWGDPLTTDAPRFDPLRQSVEAQKRQFGYNCDFTAFFPLNAASGAAERGLLCINHEYANPALMFPPGERLEVEERTAIALAAIGHSVVEIARQGNSWRVVPDSRFNRRITALDTPIALAGPAAGHPRLRTNADPTGRRAIGTLANCGGGVTPWRTVLIAEENFQGYFGGDVANAAEAANYQTYGVTRKEPRGWARLQARFDLGKEPHEPNRFGWIVEIDPYDPASTPVKRTALGRFRHESATTALAPDGRVAIYSGDDQPFQFIYRFLSARPFDPNERDANRNLLDEGTLSAARFEEDGSLRWLPLIFGRGPLVPENGFRSQAEVLIETRRAADLLGATPMDRPEDVETNPTIGSVFVMLTNNTHRRAERTNAANPRGPNRFGHILELVPPGGAGAVDHGADVYRWNVFLLAGNPFQPESNARYNPRITREGWFVAPDNCAFDSRGRLWIATDGADARTGFANGLWASDVAGPGRALTRHFFGVPRGAEAAGPCFTPGDRTLFVSVQHPGQGPKSTFAKPSTRWPDFDPIMPPRPAVVAITRKDGGPIGS